MEQQWTPAQRQAIDAKGQDILVSAAAGSGKTAVLTRRIIERITDPADPLSVDELLVVTYTKAAANELKTRIRSALLDQISQENGKNRRLRRQLLLLERAEISTIHSFCLGLIRQNAALLSLPANMRVADEGEAKRISYEVMERLLADLYKENDPAFLGLISQFAVLGDDKLTEEFVGLYEKTTSLPEGVAYFERSARQMEESNEAGLFNTPLGELLVGYVQSFVNHYEPFYTCLEPLYGRLMEIERSRMDGLSGKEKAKLEKRINSLETQRAFFANEWGSLQAILASCGDYYSLADAMDQFSFARKPSVTNAPEELSSATAFRDSCKDEFNSMQDRFFSKKRRAFLAEDFAKTAELLRVLSRLMVEFERRFMLEKQRHGVLDFSDLERYTHRLLIRDGEPTLVAKAVSLRYREIYIDEYQDVNRVQDDIFSAIAKANRFMVGDIKQSIYSFRGAEPSIFADYRQRFDHESEAAGNGQTIFLSHNFRCDQSVVDFVNLVCGDLFQAGKSIRYEDGDRLRRGKKEEKDAHVPVEIVILTEDDQSSTPDEEENDALSGSDAEAAYIAQEVERLWKEEGIPLSEMALLLRSAQSQIACYEKAFKAKGIPYTHNESMPFFEEPEILTILSLLHTIENPAQDIYLAGALTGPVFGFTLDELISLRWQEGRANPGENLYETLCRYRDSAGNEDQRIGAFFAWLEKYREASCTLSSDELIRKLYAETSLPAIVGADFLRGQAAEQNLRSFYQLARTYEKNSFRGLHRFLRYVQDLSDRGQGVERHAELGDAEAIQIVTIHHSKGLEFRVCFLGNAGKDFNQRDASAPFLFHRQMGLTLTLRDSATLGKYQTLPRQILSQRIKESGVEEEMRNLYVALTRAKERLYVVAWEKKTENAKERWQKLSRHYTFYGVNRAAHYIDWIMASLIAHPEEADACVRVNYLHSTEGGIVANPPIDADLQNEDTVCVEEETAMDDATLMPVDQNAVKEITKRFDMVYPYTEVSQLPAKLSVSRLTPDILDDEDSSTIHSVEMVTMPSFLQTSPQKLSGAEKGTATHVFMQFCDFAGVERDGVEGELLRLVNHRFMTAVMADAVDLKALKTFFASDLYGQMKAAKEIRREFRFNVQLPAMEFTKSKERSELLQAEMLLVQGVVDCCFTLPDGTIKLIDYKTDRLGKNPQEGARLLWERYGNQLYYYQLALERIFEKKVSEISLYSFHHGCEFSAEPRWLDCSRLNR